MDDMKAWRCAHDYKNTATTCLYLLSYWVQDSAPTDCLDTPPQGPVSSLCHSFWDKWAPLEPTTGINRSLSWKRLGASAPVFHYFQWVIMTYFAPRNAGEQEPGQTGAQDKTPSKVNYRRQLCRLSSHRNLLILLPFYLIYGLSLLKQIRTGKNKEEN